MLPASLRKPCCGPCGLGRVGLFVVVGQPVVGSLPPHVPTCAVQAAGSAAARPMHGAASGTDRDRSNRHCRPAEATGGWRGGQAPRQQGLLSGAAGGRRAQVAACCPVAHAPCRHVRPTHPPAPGRREGAQNVSESTPVVATPPGAGSTARRCSAAAHCCCDGSPTLISGRSSAGWHGEPLTSVAPRVKGKGVIQRPWTPTPGMPRMPTPALTFGRRAHAGGVRHLAALQAGAGLLCCGRALLMCPRRCHLRAMPGLASFSQGLQWGRHSGGGRRREGGGKGTGALSRRG